MAEHNTYDHILKQKLNQLVAPDVESMWSDMHGILDREMPQEEKGRRFIGWFIHGKNFYLSVAFLILTASVTYFVINRTNEQKLLTNEKHLTSDQVTNTVAQTSVSKETQTTTNDADDNSTGNDKQAVGSTGATEQKSSSAGSISRTVAAIQSGDNNIENNDETVQKSTPEVILQQKIDAVSEAAEYQLQIPTREQVAIIEQKGVKRIIVSGVATNRIPVVDQKTLKVSPIAHIATANTEVLIPVKESEVIQSSKEKTGEVVTNQSQVQQKIAISGLRRITDAVSLITNYDQAEKSISGSKVALNETDLLVKRPDYTSKNIFIAGLSVNYHMPVSGQEMSTITGTGRSNQVLDYLPSVFAQYHFSRKWFVQAELQYKAPQYVAPIKMPSTFTPVTPNKTYEEWSTLSKLYYMNLPVSIHYKVSDKFNVGAGVQYSYLRSSIIETNKCSWEKNSSNGWDKTYTSKKVHVKKNPKIEKNNSTAGGTPTTLTQVDTLAQSMRGNDWRLMFDMNYKWKNITGGVKFSAGLNNYIQVNTGGVSSDVKDKNQAIQLYLRYDLFRSDRKRKR